MRWVISGCVLLIALSGCGSTEGSPLDLDGLGYALCEGYYDCGTGRYCGPAGTCTADCRNSADCAYYGEGLTCNLFGQCLVPDGGRLCSSHADCGKLSYCNGKCSISGAICGGDDECPWEGEECDGSCAAPCRTDNDCRDYPGDLVCTPVGQCLLPGWEKWISPGELPPATCQHDAQCKTLGWSFECDCEKVPDSFYGEVCAGSGSGTCVKSDGQLDFGDGPQSSPAHVFTGVWGMRSQAAALTIGIPLVHVQATTSSSLVLVKVNHVGGDTLELETRECDIQLINFIDSDEPFAELAWMVIPHTYLRALPVGGFSAEVPSNHKWALFESDHSMETRGVKLDDPWNDPLPDRADYQANPEDPRFWDQDQDGHVGMTTLMDGMIRGEIYHVHRFTSRHHGLIVDHDHVRGLISATSEKKYIGASNPSLIYDVAFEMHGQLDRTFFRMMRMPDDTSCADLIREGGREDSWLKHSNHMLDVPDP